LRGKVVMVNFWATSCATCVKEMPQMVDTYNKFKDQGLEFVAVAMSYDPPNYVLNYTETRKLPFKVALDSGGDLAKQFGDVAMTPTTFVIGKDGKILKRYLGEPDFASLHALAAEIAGRKLKRIQRTRLTSRKPTPSAWPKLDAFAGAPRRPQCASLTKFLLLLACLLAAGCTSVDNGVRDTVILHYQHVANVHRIDFRNPVPLRRNEAIHFVQPLESEGFWAVFVLCSVDVTGARVPAFYYDVDRFRVQFGGGRFGPLRPYTLRLDDSIDLNTRTDTAAIVDAIAARDPRGPAQPGVPARPLYESRLPLRDLRAAGPERLRR
jgi:peroxiredoxin